MELDKEALEIAKKTKLAFKRVRSLNTDTKNRILKQVSEKILQTKDEILKANAMDLEQAKTKGIEKAMLERLALNEKKIYSLSETVSYIASLQDPVGEVVRGVTLPNGLELSTKRVPLGIILCIFESRPNVIVDVSSLCFKSGNACILRGGSEALNTNKVLVNIFQEVLKMNSLPKEIVSFIENTDRKFILPFLKMDTLIDIIVPRGGEGLIRFVTDNSTVPVIKHDKGVCNLFVDRDYDLEMAKSIVLNSKLQRTSVCNALENLILHEGFPKRKELVTYLVEEGAQILYDRNYSSEFPQLAVASDADYATEFLDERLSVKIVKEIHGAIEFIEEFGSGHTETILSNDTSSIQTFKSSLDSAGIFVNCSTRFHDGGEFGLGAEVGISTGKLHVRGPMGLTHLTTTTTYLTGEGQIRV